MNLSSSSFKGLLLIFKTFLLTLILLGFSNVKADHAQGMDIEYVCGPGANQWTVIVSFYRDCSGIPAHPLTLEIDNDCGLSNPSNITMFQDPCPPPPVGGSPCEVSPLCDNDIPNSCCNSSSPSCLPGVQKYTYQATVTLPQACSLWYFSVSVCCRNSPTNISYGSLYVEAGLNNDSIVPCNNSPTFSTTPVPYICQNKPYSYNHGAVDPDGDSLVYSIVTPLTFNGAPLVFNAPYSTAQPLGVTGPFVFDPLTGQMTFTPSITQKAAITIRVDEYRNGVHVGFTMRDIQIVVLAPAQCNSSTPEIREITNVKNGNKVDSVTVQVCPGSPLEFDVLVVDPGNNNLLVTSNLPTPQIAGTDTQLLTGDSVFLHVNWTPTPGDTGTHFFVILTENDGCPVKGTASSFIKIKVFTEVTVSPDTAVYCGTPVQLNATGGTIFSWSTPVGLDDSTSLKPFASPPTNTKYIFTSDCGVDSAFIIVDPPFTLDAGFDQNICANGLAILNVTNDTTYEPYTYQWYPTNPKNGLFFPFPGNYNLNAPTVYASPSKTTKYFVDVIASTGCVRTDSVTVNVVGVAPIVNATADPDTVCPGDLIQLSINGTPTSCGLSTQPCAGYDTTAQLGFASTAYPTTPVNFPTPFGPYAESARMQMLYSGADLATAIGAGGKINEIQFNVTNLITSPISLQDYTVKIGCTNLSSLTNWVGGLPVVYTPKTLTVTATGWVSLPFDNAYDWDGSSNLIVEICYYTPGSSGIFNAFYEYTASPNSVLHTNGSGSSQCNNNLLSNPVTDKLPNAKFTVCVQDYVGLNITWTPNIGPNSVNNPSIENPTATPQSSVSYFVDVLDSGCLGSGVVTVIVDTSVTLNAEPDTFLCTSNGVQLDAVTTGSPSGGQSFSYSWTSDPPGFTSALKNPTVNPSSTTKYIVELTGASCILTDTIEVTIGTALPLTSAVTDITCNGANDGSVSVTTTGTAPFNYTWSPGPTGSGPTITRTNLSPGTYYLTVVDAGGCTGWDTITITNPPALTVNVTGTNLDCNGDNSGTTMATVGGGTGSASYVWNVPPPNTSANLTGLAAGNYVVTVTDANGCTATDNLTLTEPPVLSGSTAGTDPSVNGGSDGGAGVNPTGGTQPYVYIWSNGNTTDTLINVSAGCYYVTVTDGNGCTYQDSVCLIDPPPIFLTPTIVHNLCDGDTIGSICVAVQGGITPYTFQWNSGQTDSCISGLGGGNYTLSVTDSAGNVVSATYTVNEPGPVVIAFTPNNISCNGAGDGNVTANVSGGTAGYTYLWNNGSTSNPINNLQAGTYCVTVTDANGCSATNCTSITEPALLTANISSTTDVSCNAGLDGQASVLAGGGTPGYTYSWPAPSTSTSSSANDLNAGFHTVTITDASGCTATDTFTLSEPPPINLSTVSTPTNCNGGSDGTAGVTALGGQGGFNYNWSGPTSGLPNAANINGLSSGTYSVTVTDAGNCTSVTSVFVGEPSAMTLISTFYEPDCYDGNNGAAWVIANGGTPPYTNYNWSNTLSTNDDDTTLNVAAGSYTVTVTDANGCTTSDNVIVTEPDELFVNVTDKNEITCAADKNGELGVTATGGTPNYQYQWTNGGTTSLIDGLAPGTYTVTVTDANGCTVSTSDDFNAPPPLQWLTMYEEDASCPGEADGVIQAQAFGGTLDPLGNSYTYSLDGVNWQPSQVFQELTAGVYTVMVQDVNGCTLDTTLLIEEPEELFVFVDPNELEIDLGTSVQLETTVQPYSGSDIKSYVWTPVNGLSCSDCPDPVATPYNTVVYQVAVTYLDQECIAYGETYLIVGDGKDVFIPNAFTPNGDGKNDVFAIWGATLRNVEMTVFNRWGEKLYQTNNQFAGWDGRYKGEYVNPGVYTYSVKLIYLNGLEDERSGSINVIR